MLHKHKEELKIWTILKRKKKFSISKEARKEWTDLAHWTVFDKYLNISELYE